jgi:hypothetical protein
MRGFFLTLLLSSLSFISYSQNYQVKGSVLDTAGIPLTGTLIKLKNGQDSIQTSADLDGNFNLNNVKWPNFTLSAAFIGFETFIKVYTISNSNLLVIPTIKLKTSSNTLDEVVITAVTAIKISEDTVTFNASSFPVRQGDAVDEILRKLPGVKVDADGNVTTQGEAITKIRINGKDFFGTDVATAIKNLPADIIKNLQIIDDFGDHANITGIKTGEAEKVLNLTIQEDKKRGYSARIYGGKGNEDRYNTSLRGNTFKGERQLSFDGTVNNINMRGGNSNGITSTNSASMNYRNDWSKKVSADAGYSFRNRRNETFSKTSSQNFLENFTRLENSVSDNNSDNYSHNFSGNIVLKPDTLNFIRISPSFSHNSDNSTNVGETDILQQTLNTVRNNISGTNSMNLNMGTRFYFNHKFSKKGRNMSLSGNLNYSNGDNDRDVFNNYLIRQAGGDSTRIQNQLIANTNNNYSLWSNLTYMEPLWAKNFLEFNYSHSRSGTTTDRITNDVISGNQIFNADLSNNYEFQFYTHRFGANYRFIEEKFNYTLGFSAQPAILKGQNITRSINTSKRTFNLIPSARLVYKFSKQQALNVNYWGRNNQPGFLQLQPITDNSNLQNTITGNPDLKPEFVHSLNARYNQSDWNMGHVLYANLSFSQTQDKIVTTKIQIPNTVNQLTSYINTDGFYSLRGDYSYGKPFAERKYTLTYSGSANLNNNVAYIDQNRNVAKNFLVRQELEFEVDINDVIDVELETSYAINKTQYSQSNFTDRQTNSLSFQLRGRNYFFKDLTLGYDLRKTINTGFDDGIVRNPTILRLFTEYRFLKGNNGTIRFEGNDLLNQNTGISRDVFDNIIIDRQINRLGQYFMLSFAMRLNKFGGGPK